VCRRRTRDFRQCVQSVCDESTGGCTDVQAPDGTNCTDGSLCTTNDMCVAGQCIGTPLVCNLHASQCKRTVCNPLTGENRQHCRMCFHCLALPLCLHALYALLAMDCHWMQAGGSQSADDRSKDAICMCKCSCTAEIILPCRHMASH
jgi:hypothetical protein